MKRFFKENWIYLLGGLGVILLYFLRFYHLTLLPVFVDEAIYIRWSQIMANEPTLRFLPLSDGKEPLFMWFLMFVINRIQDPLFAGRLISVLSGFGTMIGVSLLSYVLFKNKVAALLAGFLYALSPFTFFFDRLALVDSMLGMFGVWTFILSYFAFKHRRLDFSLLAGFALGGAWLTKSTAILFTLMLPSLWLLTDWKKKQVIRLLLKLTSLLLVTIVIAFGMYNILRLGPNFNLIASRNQDYVYPLNHILVSMFDPFKGHIVGIANYFYLMGPIGLVALWLISYAVNLKKEWKKLFVLSAWALLPIIATAEYFKVVTARYIVYTVPFFIVISSAVVLGKSKLIRLATLLALAIFIIQSILFNYKLLTDIAAAPLPQGERSGYLEEWTAGQGIKEISLYLKDQAKTLKPGEKFVVGTEGFFGTLPDGLQMYMQGTSNVTVIGVGLNIDKIPESLVASKAAGNRTFLVINKSRLSGNYEKMGLKLVASYEKPARRVGSREYQFYGPSEVLYLFEIK